WVQQPGRAGRRRQALRASCWPQPLLPCSRPCVGNPEPGDGTEGHPAHERECVSRNADSLKRPGTRWRTLGPPPIECQIELVWAGHWTPAVTCHGSATCAFGRRAGEASHFPDDNDDDPLRGRP